VTSIDQDQMARMCWMIWIYSDHTHIETCIYAVKGFSFAKQCHHKFKLKNVNRTGSHGISIGPKIIKLNQETSLKSQASEMATSLQTQFYDLEPWSLISLP
jgi:hypothetical protein